MRSGTRWGASGASCTKGDGGFAAEAGAGARSCSEVVSARRSGMMMRTWAVWRLEAAYSNGTTHELATQAHPRRIAPRTPCGSCMETSTPLRCWRGALLLAAPPPVDCGMSDVQCGMWSNGHSTFHLQHSTAVEGRWLCVPALRRPSFVPRTRHRCGGGLRFSTERSNPMVVGSIPYADRA